MACRDTDPSNVEDDPVGAQHGEMMKGQREA